MRRRGLSPLVATVLLISATVLGGILVYQYFQSSVSHAKGLQQSVTLTADAITLNTNTTLVRVTVVNQGSDNVLIKSIILLDQYGNPLQAQIVQGSAINQTIAPGDRATVILKTSQRPNAAYIQFEENGKTYSTEPVEIPH